MGLSCLQVITVSLMFVSAFFVADFLLDFSG